jgi:hypothetical protein
MFEIHRALSGQSSRFVSADTQPAMRTAWPCPNALVIAQGTAPCRIAIDIGDDQLAAAAYEGLSQV